jgi:hypothetical protein
MSKQFIGAQGEVNIFRIDTLPEKMETKPVERIDKGFIISHSEKGSHHLLTGGDVMERTTNIPAGMRVFHAILADPQALIQDAQVPHEGYNLPPGIYEFRISREYNPFLELARQVAD